MKLTGPFIAVEGRDVTVFRTREKAQGYLEAQDVEDGIYLFYAADGTRLRLTTQKGRTIVTDEPLGYVPEQLASSLRAYLLGVPEKKRTLSDRAIMDADLGGLVNEMLLGE